MPDSFEFHLFSHAMLLIILCNQLIKSFHDRLKSAHAFILRAEATEFSYYILNPYNKYSVPFNQGCIEVSPLTPQVQRT